MFEKERGGSKMLILMLILILASLIGATLFEEYLKGP